MLSLSCVHLLQSLIFPPHRLSGRRHQQKQNAHVHHATSLLHMTGISHSLFSYFAFPFHSHLHFSFTRFNSGPWNTFAKTNQENICLVRIFLHNWGPGWLSQQTMFVSEVCFCVYFVSYFNFLHHNLHISPPKKRLQIPSRHLKCNLMVERASAERLSDRLSCQGSGPDSEPLSVWI